MKRGLLAGAKGALQTQNEVLSYPLRWWYRRPGLWNNLLLRNSIRVRQLTHFFFFCQILVISRMDHFHLCFEDLKQGLEWLRSPVSTGAQMKIWVPSKCKDIYKKLIERWTSLSFTCIASLDHDNTPVGELPLPFLRMRKPKHREFKVTQLIPVCPSLVNVITLTLFECEWIKQDVHGWTIERKYLEINGTLFKSWLYYFLAGTYPENSQFIHL